MKFCENCDNMLYLKNCEKIMVVDTKKKERFYKYIETNIISGAPGVYVQDKKIASIGLRISRGKTYHGISLNVNMDLEPFSRINPCGYEGLEVTQMSDFDSNITMKGVDFKVLAIPSNGTAVVMEPGKDYDFPGAAYVKEIPLK